jgi:hypothetical protein
MSFRAQVSLTPTLNRHALAAEDQVYMGTHYSGFDPTNPAPLRRQSTDVYRERLNNERIRK